MNHKGSSQESRVRRKRGKTRNGRRGGRHDACHSSSSLAKHPCNAGTERHASFLSVQAAFNKIIPPTSNHPRVITPCVAKPNQIYHGIIGYPGPSNVAHSASTTTRSTIKGLRSPRVCTNNAAPHTRHTTVVESTLGEYSGMYS